MVFKRIRSVFGGGTTVDAVVHTPVAQPGGPLQGVVEIVGGSDRQDISALALELVCQVEVEHEDGESKRKVAFARHQVHGAFTLEPGQRIDAPFQLLLPLETPINVLGGHDLHGVQVGLRTELEIARSLDKGDYDAIRVEPMPAQQRLLVALDRIGCRFLRADVEHGRIRGAQLPFYQELEFAPPPSLRGRVNEIEVTFLPGQHEIEMILEADKRGGLLTEGSDTVRRLPISYGAIGTEDWESFLLQQLEEMGRRRGLFG